MRLNLILPKVEPNDFEFPKKCPREGCQGMRFIPRQEVSKKIVDAQHPEVTAWRCECSRCGYVFRVYPKGVSRKQISKRVNGMAVMMYILGLSYGAVEIVLRSLGMGIGKTSVYRAVQAVSEQVPGMKSGKLLSGYKTKAVGVDVTSVRCNGKWVTVGVVVDAMNGIVLSVDELAGEDAELVDQGMLTPDARLQTSAIRSCSEPPDRFGWQSSVSWFAFNRLDGVTE